MALFVEAKVKRYSSSSCLALVSLCLCLNHKVLNKKVRDLVQVRAERFK